MDHALATATQPVYIELFTPGWRGGVVAGLLGHGHGQQQSVSQFDFERLWAGRCCLHRRVYSGIFCVYKRQLLLCLQEETCTAPQMISFLTHSASHQVQNRFLNQPRAGGGGHTATPKSCTSCSSVSSWDTLDVGRTGLLCPWR